MAYDDEYGVVSVLQ